VIVSDTATTAVHYLPSAALLHSLSRYQFAITGKYSVVAWSFESMSIFFKL
jgi:hypothetical protein